MSRTAAPPEDPPATPMPDRWSGAIRFVAAIAGALLSVYLVYPVIGGYVEPIGPDGPLYVWWTRFAEMHGLSAVPYRAGGPGAALVLGRLLGTEPMTTVAILGPALGVAVGLAGGAVIEALLGPDRLRTAAAAAFTGAWAGSLAGSYVANLALTGAFLIAVAALGLSRRSWAAVWGAAGLLAAAGLAHGAFMTILAAILAGVVALHAGESLEAVRRGTPLRDVFAVRLLAGTTGGFLAAGAGLLWLRDGVGLPVDSSRDAWLRRAGLRGLLRATFRLRTLADLVRFALPLAGAGVLTRRGGVPGVDENGRYLRRVLGWWAALSLLAFVVLGITGRGQANRLLAFGFFAPLAGAAALRGALARRRAWALVAAAILLGGGMYGWYRQGSHMKLDERTTIAAAASSIAHLPADTPVIFLVDTIDAEAAAYHMTRYANVIRAVFPVERIPHVHVVLGRPRNYLLGRPTVYREVEHDATSRISLREAEDVRERAITFVAEPLNVPWIQEARALGRELVGNDVIALGPRAGEPRGEARTIVAGTDAARGYGPTAIPLLAIPLLALLALVGAGWSRWMLPGASRTAVVLAAPSAGLAAVILAAVAVDRLGVGLSSWPAAGVVVALAAAGYALAVQRRA